MKERPIIFNGDMVRALLDGKTQTRRVIKYPEPWMIEFDGEGHYCEDKYGERRKVTEYCPYGIPGDRLWVRETWAYHPDLPQNENEGAILYSASRDRESDHKGLFWQMTCDGTEREILVEHWRPSIHMFQWMSRITLEVTDVKVERICAISNEDIKAEGILGDSYLEIANINNRDPHSARVYFEELWDSINAKRGYGWDDNPWVWVITFKRIKP